VIVDKTAAERIIRARLFSDPLSFGAMYRVRLWTRRQQPPPTVLAAVNHEGLHLYSCNREPRHMHTLFFEWHRASSIVGWQEVEHEFDSAAERELAEETFADEAYGHTSLVVHVLVPPVGELAVGSGAPAEAPAEAAGTDAPDGGVYPFSRAGARVAFGGGGNTARELDGNWTARLMESTRNSHRHSHRESTARAAAETPRERQRSKLILLTTEGADMQEKLAAHAQEYTNRLRSRARADASEASNGRRNPAMGSRRKPPSLPTHAEKAPPTVAPTNLMRMMSGVSSSGSVTAR